MFDNLEIRKSFTIQDNITGNNIEVCSFNTTLNKYSGIHQNMNITYPKLYELNKDLILESYREYNAEVTALAVSMGLSDVITNESKLDILSDVRGEIKDIVRTVMNEVIGELGNIQINPVPTMEVNYDMYR